MGRRNIIYFEINFLISSKNKQNFEVCLSKLKNAFVY